MKYVILNSSVSTTAGDVYLADSAQVPRVHVLVHRGDSRAVLGLERRILELKLHEEESKYTEARAEVFGIFLFI